MKDERIFSYSYVKSHKTMMLHFGLTDEHSSNDLYNRKVFTIEITHELHGVNELMNKQDELKCLN